MAFTEESLDLQKIIQVNLNDEMRKSFLDYSMSVITARALPDVRDGLKPVHRRILYTMFENSLWPDKPYRKCADTVGSVLGRYHPHGDASVYDAMVRLAQDFSMRYMLVDGHGNFGSVDGDPPAAYRYTESRMSKLSLELLADIDKETVDFIPNYDDRLKEPSVLPSKFPNLLVNGSSGIAVGMATNIPPHNLGEVIDACSMIIDNPDASLEELMSVIPGPDFPTAGIIMGKSGIRAAYATGRGKITLRAKAELVEDKNGRFRIVVTELPYQVNKAKLHEHIGELVKEKRIEGIADANDYSSREGMQFVVTLKRDANPQVVLNQLFSLTQMQATVGVILLALVNGEPKILTLKQMLENYIKFQCEVITRSTKYDLRKARERAHILDGLLIALDFIDEVIALLRAAKSIPEGKAGLMERFGLDDVQAQAIVQMRLGQLTGLERQKIEDEMTKLKELIAYFLELLSSETNLLAKVKEELLAIGEKYKDERRTQIVNVSGEVDIEDLIPQETCVFTLSDMGYLKRVPAETYQTQHRGGRGIVGMAHREEDATRTLFTGSTHEHVMFFTSKGRTFRLKGYEIPEGSRSAKGMNAVNLLQLEADETLSAMIPLPKEQDGLFVCMATRRGVIKRTALDEYKNVRKSGLRAINLDEGDELAWVQLTTGADQLILATKKGMVIRFAESDARVLGRTARGVRAIRLREGDSVVGFGTIAADKEILTVSETGFGRRSLPEDYRLQSRGGLGTKNYRVDRYGDVAAIAVIDPTDELIMISDSGVLIRIAAAQIRLSARPGKGVKVMRLSEGGRVVSLSALPAADDEEAEPLELLPEEPDDEADDVLDEDIADETDEDSAEDIADDADETAEDSVADEPAAPDETE
ncbi:MAG: DNA gyrase subunit A [Oscillospiraceae bacterium]|jgi:DNA gyrase subunit A|nr:DNA gyrase subunit A [Oscillospiraceae bacterium]